MSFRLVSACAVLAAAALGSACSDDGKPCDPGQVIENRLCVPGPKPDAGAPDVEIGEDGETPDGATEDAVDDRPPGMFGKPCTMAGEGPECAPPAPYCAISPSGTAYCSALGCKEDRSICPPGWGCLEVGGLSVCTRPP